MFWTKKSHFKVSSLVLVCAMLMQLSSGLFVSAVAMPFYDTGSNESVVDTGNGDSGNIDDEGVLESGDMPMLRAPKVDMPMPAGFITSVEVFEKIDEVTDAGTPFAPDKEFAKDEKFYLKYNYKIPSMDSGSEIVEGVTYVFDIPEQIDTTTQEQTVPVTYNGITVADAIIHIGKVKITFNDGAEESGVLKAGVEGNFWFQKRFDKDKVNNGGKQTLDFTITNGGTKLEKDINFTIDKVEAKVTMKKEATPNLSALDNTSIDWLVTATAEIKDPKNPNVIPEVPATITDLVITDIIEAPMLYVGNSVTVKKHTASNTAGDVVNPNCAVYDEAKKTITVTIPNGNSLANDEYYTIGYKTTFDFATVFKDETKAKFTNTAKTTGFKHTQYEKDADGKTETTVAENKTEVSATKDVTLTADFLDKSGSLVGGKINWTVTIKPGTFSFTGGTITDIIPEGLTLEKASVKWGAKDKGVKVDEDISTPPAEGDYSISAKKPTSTLTYKMGALPANDTPTLLTYTTTVDSGYANLDNSFKNEVNFNPNNGPAKGFTKTATVHYGGSVFTKTAKDYIPSTHTIPWEISFGETGGTELLNPVITEVLPEGLTLVSESIFVTDQSGDEKITVDGDEIKFTSAGTELEIKLTKGTKYDEPALVFTVTGTVKYNHIIKFNTTVDSETYWAANTKNGDEITELQNTAYIKVAGMNEHDVTAKPKVPSEILTKAKDLDYDYKTKLASWVLEVNQNQMAMTAPTIVDTLETAGLSYVQETVEVTLRDVPVTVTPTFSVVGGKPTMTIVLPTVDANAGTYVIKYKTAVADSILEAQTRTIANSAVLSSTTFPNKHATVTQTQDIAQPLVTKTGKDTGKWYITWSVMINQNGATLENTIIEDVLATGLMLDPSSIKLEKLKLNDDGTFTGENDPENDVTNDGTVSFDVNENAANLKVLKVEFTKTIKDPYKLTFDTYYTEDARFTNSITLNANGSAFTANSGNVNAESNSSGGSTKPVFGEIVLIKKDKATDELLQGAFFKLGSIIKTTDANGEIIFDDMRKGQKCTITEVKAPYGYKLAEPIEITVSDFNNQSKFEYPIPNTRITNDLTITKTDDKTPATALNGAVFTVTRTIDGANDNITFEPVTITSGKTTTLKTVAGTGANVGKFVTIVDTSATNTGEKGKAILKGLPVGSYTVTETTAPNGYVLDTNSTYNFKVENAGATPAHTFKNKQILGSLKLTKTDKNDTTKLLAGAVFNVTNAVGTPAYTETITTDVDGKATLSGLPVGTYTVTETTAPNGYVLDGTPQNFEIVGNGTATAVPVVLTFTNEKIEGMLLVTKTDDQTSAKPLQGAEFTVTNAVGTPAFTQTIATDANGVATFKLPAGNYSVVETKAPSGYVLNATPQNVTIVARVTEQPEQVTLSFTNTQILGSLELTKTDELDNRLEGAEFSVTKAGTPAFTATITTDVNGKATLASLLVGEYTVTETKAPNGYVLSTTPQTFVIDDNGIAQPAPKPLTFKNTWAKGKLQISKTDAATGAVLAGAEFTIVKIDGGYSQKVTTGADGKAEVTELPRGNYEVTEVKAPKGYQIDNGKQTFAITDTATEVKLSFTNTFILGNLELTKTDDKTPAKPLEGAKFELYNAVGDALVAEGITDKDGKLLFDNLPEGNYYYKEKQPPVGYVKDETKRAFSITVNGQIVEETFKNKVVPPSNNNGGGHTPSVSPPPEVVVVPPPTAPPSPLPGTPPNTTPQISTGIIEITPAGTPDIAVPPANGTVTIDKDGKWVYTPKAGFVGEDEFTVTATYPSGYTETFVIKLSVLSGYSQFLPETGEAPRTMFYVGGVLLIVLGVVIKRKLKKI